MVPSLFVWLDALPLTANGKVDRAGLPPPVFGGDGAGYVPPRSEVERVLVGVWERVLGVARVGVHDNLFDLGGDSLLAVMLLNRTADEGLLLSFQQLFERQTVASLSTVVRQRNALATTDLVDPATMVDEVDRQYALAFLAEQDEADRSGR